MKSSLPQSSRVLFAAALVAMSSLLAACDQVVSSANAQSHTSVVSGEVAYFGDEYAAAQARLGVDAAPQPPSF
jgi:hypothetical protein